MNEQEQQTLAEARKQIDQLERIELPGDLSRDLATLRYVINCALAQKNYPLVVQAETALARTNKEQLRAMCVNSMYLSREAVFAFVEQISKVVQKHASRVIGDSEMRADLLLGIADELDGLTLPVNSTDEIKKLRREEFGER